MKNYLEKVLHQKVTLDDYNNIFEDLPLVFRGRYNAYLASMNGVSWIILQPKVDVGLVTLRKDRLRVEQVANLNCALFLDSTTFYIREKLLEEGIPFILKDKQIYLPFIGYLLAEAQGRNIAPVRIISFLTQKLILTAIYEKWNNVTVSEAAVKLGVTKMSARRSCEEREYLAIAILGMKGKSRVIIIPDDIKELWNQIQPILRNPVIARYELKEDVQIINKAGISALCEYTLLEDNQYPTYAVTKKDAVLQKIKKMSQAYSEDDIGSVVLELGYFIDFENKSIEDPISVALSVKNEAEEDRVAISVEEMLKEYLC